jgi:hypothetical protein
MFSNNKTLKECCGVDETRGIKTFPCDLCINNYEEHTFVCLIDIIGTNEDRIDINDDRKIFKEPLSEIPVFDNTVKIGTLVVTECSTWNRLSIIKCFSDYNDFNKIGELCIRKSSTIVISSVWNDVLLVFK